MWKQNSWSRKMFFICLFLLRLLYNVFHVKNLHARGWCSWLHPHNFYFLKKIKMPISNKFKKGLHGAWAPNQFSGHAIHFQHNLEEFSIWVTLFGDTLNSWAMYFLVLSHLSWVASCPRYYYFCQGIICTHIMQPWKYSLYF
jgi:hypothetical protein